MARSRKLTFRGSRLAGELRRWRENAGLSQEQVGQHLATHFTSISRIERGLAEVQPATVTRMLDLYGVPSPTRESLVQLAKEASIVGWWTAYGDVFTGSYVDMEDSATLIRDWEIWVVPGLLQTSAYARALIRAGLPDAPDHEVEQRLRARMARKPLLERDNAPQMHAVLDEAVFRRAPTNRDVMRGQIRALVETPPHVTIQVLPFEAGWHGGMAGPIVILDFPEELSPPKAYSEGPGGDAYIESMLGVKRCKLVFEAAQQAALSPEDTRAWLTRLAEEY